MNSEKMRWDTVSGDKDKSHGDVERENQRLLEEKETAILEDLSHIQRLLHPLKAKKMSGVLDRIHHDLKILRVRIHNLEYGISADKKNEDDN